LADIEYHFVPGLDGQPFGYAQFADIAPVEGPDSFTVRVSGAMVGNDPSGDAYSASAYLDKWGLGVFNPVAGKDTGVQGQVELDGRNGGEYLRLEFEVPVQLTHLTFASVGLGDKFSLVADGVEVDLLALFPGLLTIKSISDAQGNWPGEIDFTQAAEPLVFATVWDILAGGPEYGDGVQLENVGVTPVPEPATLMLWCAGIAGAGVLLVRRRNARTLGGAR
jgi:hypothetical protein